MHVMGEVMSPFDSDVPAGQPAVLLVQHNRFSKRDAVRLDARCGLRGLQRG